MMYAAMFNPGWIPTEDLEHREIAYTFWTGKDILAYVSGEGLIFNAWVFGEPKFPFECPECYQYKDKQIMAWSRFSSWPDARDWAVTLTKLGDSE